jgi:hypothetical protein
MITIDIPDEWMADPYCTNCKEWDFYDYPLEYVPEGLTDRELYALDNPNKTRKPDGCSMYLCGTTKCTHPNAMWRNYETT